MLNRKGLRFINGILIISMYVALAGFGHASTIEEGLANYRNGHYQQAAKTFSTPSAQDNPDVQYCLAMMHLQGKGVEKDPSLGVEWLEIAAGNNHSTAQYELYRLRNTDKNRLISNEKARYWLEKAAENGHPDAMLDKGKAIMAEKKDDKNWENAFIWFLRAAESGNPIAEDIVGFYYEFGIGVEQDADKARTYYERSAAQNNSDGIADLARLYETGKSVPRNPEKAHELFSLALKQNNKSAQYAFANYYRDGNFVPQNNIKAFEYYEKSASQGYLPAIWQMIRIYEQGLFGQPADKTKAQMWHDLDARYTRLLPVIEPGISDYLKNFLTSLKPSHIIWLCIGCWATRRSIHKQKVEQALGWYKKGDYQRAYATFIKPWAKINPDTFTTLGEMYLYGQGVEKNMRVALEYFLKGSNKKRHRAQFLIGLMNENGIGMGKKPDQAAYWYTEAAENGNAEAANNLGVLNYIGAGVPQNVDSARYWFEKGANLNSGTAIANLACLYHQGLGVEKNEARAIELIRASAAQMCPAGLYNLAKAYQYGFGIPENEEKHMQYLTDAANRNYLPAIFDLIDILENNLPDGVTNNEQLRHWRSKINLHHQIIEEKALTYLVKNDFCPV